MVLHGYLQAEEIFDLAIIDAAIIDVRTGEVSYDRTILVDGDRVVSIVSSESGYEARERYHAEGSY